MGMSVRERFIAAGVHVLVLAVAAGFIWFLLRIADILVMLVVAGIIASGVSPIIDGVARTRLVRRLRVPRGVTVLVVFVALTVLVAGLAAGVITPLITQATRLVADAPRYIDLLRGWVTDLQARYPALTDAATLINRFLEQVTTLAPPVLETALGAAARIAGAVANAVTVWVITVYMLLDARRLKSGLLVVFPAAWRPMIGEILHTVGRRFGLWLRAQAFLMFIIAAMSTLGLTLLGVPYALFLGAAAGLGELVPILGPVLSAIPAVLVALGISPWLGLGVIVFYAVLQQIEGNFLVPRVMREALGIPPLLTIVALLVGFRIGGIGGMLLAVPMAAGLQTVGAALLSVAYGGGANNGLSNKDNGSEVSPGSRQQRP